MRLGVLDVGSNTVHLLVVDAHRGAHPLPAYSEKSVLRLAEHVSPAGELSDPGADALVEAVGSAKRAAERLGTDELLAFATSAVRDARNSDAVLARVHRQTGVELEVLSGDEEAALTFLAVRRWFGWSAGRLLCVDIGGGSLEIATGLDEAPDVTVSVPLGAGRLTRERFTTDPPSRREVNALREYVDATLERTLRPVRSVGPADLAGSTSKAFRTLGRLAGAVPSSAGPRATRLLTRTGLDQVTAFISRISASDLAELDGVSAGRAHQLLAAAVVAESAMRQLELDQLRQCPWALREGVILRRLDWLDTEGPAPGNADAVSTDGRMSWR